MSAPDAVLRLAPCASGDERQIELIPALAPASRITRHHGISPQVRLALDSYELRLPGIGGRYLGGRRGSCGRPGVVGGGGCGTARCPRRPVLDVGRLVVRSGPRSGRARPSGRTCPSRGGDSLHRRAVGTGPDTGRPYGLRPHAGRLGSGSRVRGRRVRTAAADRPHAGGRRGRRPDGIHGSRAGVRARRAVGDRAAGGPGDPGGLAGRPPRAGGRRPRCGWCRAPLVGSTCRRCAPAIRP